MFIYDNVLLEIALFLGVLSFGLYRLIDLLQVRTIRGASRPTDLERIDDAVFEKKRKRKSGRTWKNFFKTGVSWGAQAGYILAMPFFVNIMHGSFGLSHSTMYTILMVAGYLLNLTLSRLFSLWTPALPFVGLDHRPVGTAHRQPSWRPANLLWHAWGLASWAVPVYFLVGNFGAAGWVGSVIFMSISQLLQLVVFIYSIKKRAIPYKQYAGFSDTFKENMHTYLQSQGIRDDEVGVVKGMKVGPNAFATSLTSKYRQIIMTEELVEGFPDPQNPDFKMKLGEDTLESIIAHEVGHINNHHVEKSVFVGTLISALVTIAVYYIFASKNFNPEAILFNKEVFAKDQSHQIIAFWGKSFFNLILTYPLTFYMIGRTRGNEVEADTHLLDTNGCKNGADFFHQIRHIAPVPNHPWWSRCNMTHPDPQEREERMLKWHDEHCKDKA